MKKLLITCLVLTTTVMLLFTGCARIVTLASPVTRSYDLSGFATVEVGHTSEWFQIGQTINIPVTVTLTQSDAYQVSVTANENIFDDISVSKNGTALRVIVNRLKIGNPDATVQIQIAAPSLAGIKVDGVDMTANVTGSVIIGNSNITTMANGDVNVW